MECRLTLHFPPTTARQIRTRSSRRVSDFTADTLHLLSCTLAPRAFQIYRTIGRSAVLSRQTAPHPHLLRILRPSSTSARQLPTLLRLYRSLRHPTLSGLSRLTRAAYIRTSTWHCRSQVTTQGRLRLIMSTSSTSTSPHLGCTISPSPFDAWTFLYPSDTACIPHPITRSNPSRPMIPTDTCVDSCLSYHIRFSSSCPI